MPNKENTFLSEGGTNLSGGQKQRISLARSIYKERDIYFFDDILSALDVKVGKSIFQKVVKEMLGNKIVVLITNQLQFCSFSDQIIVLNEGNVECSGNFKEIIFKNEFFKSMMESYKENMEEDVIDDGKIYQSLELSFSTSKRFENMKLSTSGTEFDFTNNKLLISSFEENEIKEIKNVTEKEEKEEGTVSLKVWFTYIKEFGIFVSIILLFVMLFDEGLKGTSDLWITFIFDKPFKLSKDQYIYIYSIFIGTHLVLFLFKVIFFFYWSIKTSNKMHQNMFLRVIRGTVGFFYKNPAGRILNRFSKDQELVESTIPDFLSETLFKFMEMIVLIAVISYILPWFLIGVPVFFILVVVIAYYARPISHILQREEATRRSPILSHLQQSIFGFLSIHIFGVEDKFKEKNNRNLDNFSSVYYTFYCVDFWRSMRILFSSKILVAIICFLVVGIRDKLTPSKSSLIVSNSFVFAETITWLVYLYLECESKMVSVERIKNYSENIPIEPEYHLLDNKPPKEWPNKGFISFENVSIKYEPKLPFILKDISFQINPQEKIAIVGRLFFSF